MDEFMRDALEFLSTYEKDPPEVLKDEFAYDRLLEFVHDVARTALAGPCAQGCMEKETGKPHPKHQGRCNRPTGRLGVVSCYCTTK